MNIREHWHHISLLVLLEIVLGLSAVILPPLVPLILFMAGAGFLVFLINPQLGYAFTILALALDGISILAYEAAGAPGAKTLNLHHILILITFIVLFLQITRDRLPLRVTGLELPLLFFLLWMCTTLLWVPKRSAGIILIVRMLTAWAFLFSGVQLFRETRDIRRLFTIWFCLGLADVLLTFLFPHGYKFSPIIGMEWTRETLGRARAFTQHPNTLATQLVLSILLGLGLLFSAETRVSRWFLGLSTTAMLLALLLTTSRGWIAVLPVGAAFFFYKTGRLKRYVLVCAALLAVTAVFVSVRPDVRDMLVWRFLRAPPEAELSEVRIGEAIQSINVRAELWKAGLELFKQTYGLGIGAGGFAAVVGSLLPERASQQLHSIYLTVIFELGIPGVILFLWLLVSFHRRIQAFSAFVRGRPEETLFFAWYAGWLSILLNGLLRITPGSIPFWGFMGMGVIIMNAVSGSEKAPGV
jgi:O-antigen ligase